MKMIAAIAFRELKSQFLSPLAWSVLAVLQFILAYLFLSQIDSFNMLQPHLAGQGQSPGLTDLVVVPLYGNAGLLLLLITPLLTMRLISQERRNMTLSLLLAAPITSSEIIFGKFAAVLGLFFLMILLTSLMPLALLAGGTLDFGKLSANILALCLLLTSFSSIGLFMSCIVPHPTLAALGSFGMLLLLWLIDLTADFSNTGTAVLQYFSLLKHFQNLQTGLVNSADISYFLLLSATFLTLSILRLESDRLLQ